MGSIQYIDYFGNLITNISGNEVAGQAWWVIAGDRKISGSLTYSSAPPGEMIALIGSHGWVEIAVNGGSAESVLQLGVGTIIEVVLSL